MVVKAALLAANTSYQVFFLYESPSNETYSAIVAIKKENVISQTQQVDLKYFKKKDNVIIVIILSRFLN